MISFEVKDTKIWLGGEDITGALSSVEVEIDTTPRFGAGGNVPGPGSAKIKQRGFCGRKDFEKINDRLNNAYGKVYSFIKPIQGGILEYSVRVDSIMLIPDEEVSNIVPFKIEIGSRNKPERKKINSF